MKVKHFLSALEHHRVHQAIKSAEEGNSGDIVLFITHKKVNGDPVTAAHAEFRKLRLGEAKDQNSLLIFVAPKSQQFGLVGGKAFHEKVGQAWWNDLSAVLIRHFKATDYTTGLVAAIEMIGVALKQHFPCATTDRTGQKDIVEE